MTIKARIVTEREITFFAAVPDSAQIMHWRIPMLSLNIDDPVVQANWTTFFNISSALEPTFDKLCTAVKSLVEARLRKQPLENKINNVRRRLMHCIMCKIQADVKIKYPKLEVKIK